MNGLQKVLTVTQWIMPWDFLKVKVYQGMRDKLTKLALNDRIIMSWEQISLTTFKAEIRKSISALKKLLRLVKNARSFSSSAKQLWSVMTGLSTDPERAPNRSFNKHMYIYCGKVFERNYQLRKHKIKEGHLVKRGRKEQK